jgi:hypothetical protein
MWQWLGDNQASISSASAIITTVIAVVAGAIAVLRALPKLARGASATATAFTRDLLDEVTGESFYALRTSLREREWIGSKDDQKLFWRLGNLNEQIAIAYRTRALNRVYLREYWRSGYVRDFWLFCHSIEFLRAETNNAQLFQNFEWLARRLANKQEVEEFPDGPAVGFES